MIKARQVPTCTRAQERFCIWCALGPLAAEKLDLLDVTWGYGVSDDTLTLFWPATKWHGNHPHRTWRIHELSQRSPEDVSKVFDEIADYVHLIHTSR
jgi:hypothetical protein